MMLLVKVDRINFRIMYMITSAVTIIEIDIEIAILHGDRMGSKSRSFLFDLRRFSLGDGQQSARDVITKVITRDALDFVGTEAGHTDKRPQLPIYASIHANLPTTASCMPNRTPLKRRRRCHGHRPWEL